MGTRETRLAAVVARLQQVGAGGDLSLVRHPDAVREAQPGDEGSRELATAIRLLTPCFIANIGDQPQVQAAMAR